MKDLVVSRGTRYVRCSKIFAEVIAKELTKARHQFNRPLATLNDLAVALMHMFVACVGADARLIFVGERGPHRLLHVNEYNMDKAFVYAMLLLSRILKQQSFPSGFYDTWPPVCSDPAHSLAAAIDGKEPHLRVSQAGSSSG
jgi:hypothetical protein